MQPGEVCLKTPGSRYRISRLSNDWGNHPKWTGTHPALWRFVNTLIGVGIVLPATLWLWPSRGAKLIPYLIADELRAAALYLREAVDPASRKAYPAGQPPRVAVSAVALTEMGRSHSRGRGEMTANEQFLRQFLSGLTTLLERGYQLDAHFQFQQ